MRRHLLTRPCNPSMHLSQPGPDAGSSSTRGRVAPSCWGAGSAFTMGRGGVARGLAPSSAAWAGGVEVDGSTSLAGRG